MTLLTLELLTSTEDTVMAEGDTRISEGVKETTMGLVFGVNMGMEEPVAAGWTMLPDLADAVPMCKLVGELCSVLVNVLAI